MITLSSHYLVLHQRHFVAFGQWFRYIHQVDLMKVCKPCIYWLYICVWCLLLLRGGGHCDLILSSALIALPWDFFDISQDPWPDSDTPRHTWLLRVYKTILNSFVKDFGYFQIKMADVKFRSGPCWEFKCSDFFKTFLVVS